MTTQCYFCESKAHTQPLSNTFSYESVNCEVCKRYYISAQLIHQLQSVNLNGDILKCIHENIQANQEDRINTAWTLASEPIPPFVDLVVRKEFNTFKAFPIDHSDKLSAILNIIAKKVGSAFPFEAVSFNKKDLFSFRILSHDELIRWTGNLEQSGFIKAYAWDNPEEHAVSLTPDGWSAIKEKKLNSKKAFIAMAFDWTAEYEQLRLDYLEAIREGCRDCGYNANIVTPDHTGHIVDKIIAEIKESDFMVADFTYNNRGAYFEAGYARALGLPVIHTVMEGHINGTEPEKKLHFDIQQINYIKWSDPAELRERIRDRIKAVIE